MYKAKIGGERNKRKWRNWNFKKSKRILKKIYFTSWTKEKRRIVYKYRCIDVISDNLTFYNCVDHYEKSKEYIAAEKLTEEIKKICSSWYIYNTLELLKSYKITKKRK